MNSLFKRSLKTIAVPLLCTSLVGIGSASYVYRGNIKTYFRLKEKINFDKESIKDYKKRSLENDISKVLYNAGIQGVYVLYAPSQSGKTTAIKKVLQEMQESNATSNLTMYDWENNNEQYIKTFHLKPIYIDVSKDHDQHCQCEILCDDFANTIPKNTKVIVVLDNMSKNILDGFDECSWSDKNVDDIKRNYAARSFYSFHAVNSYNTDLKYVVVVVTNDKDYATDILTCNGSIKVHQIRT